MASVCAWSRPVLTCASVLRCQWLARRLALLGPATLKSLRRRRCCGIPSALAPTNHIRQPVDHQVDDAIVGLRTTLTRYGDDVGAATIAEHLAGNPRITKVAAVSTIWRIGTRRGFITAQPHKTTPLQRERVTAEEPNELWQAACRCPSSLCIPSAPTPCGSYCVRRVAVFEDGAGVDHRPHRLSLSTLVPSCCAKSSANQ